MSKRRKQEKSKFVISTCFEWDDVEVMRPLIRSCDMGTIGWVASTMYRLRKNATSGEVTVAKHLWNNKVRFISQAPFRISRKFYFADFYIPSINAIIEIDGSSHDSAEREKYDKNRDEAFASIGIKTIRISNYDAYQGRYKNRLKLPVGELLNEQQAIKYLKEDEGGPEWHKKVQKIKKILHYE